MVDVVTTSPSGRLCEGRWQLRRMECRVRGCGRRVGDLVRAADGGNGHRSFASVAGSSAFVRQSRRLACGLLGVGRAHPRLPYRRLYRRAHARGWDGADADEVQFRDGIHGLLVWAVSIVIGGIIAALAATSAAHIGVEVGKAALPDRGTIVEAAVDTMFRPQVAAAQTADNSGAVARGSYGTGATGPRKAVTPPSTPAEARSEIARSLTVAVSDGKLNASEKTYLAQIVSAQTGLPPGRTRKSAWTMPMRRRSALSTRPARPALLPLLRQRRRFFSGLAAAWYAAQHGGRHRDNNIPAKFTFLRRSAIRPVTGAGPP